MYARAYVFVCTSLAFGELPRLRKFVTRGVYRRDNFSRNDRALRNKANLLINH